ncbi:glycosyltransferase [Candidatus Microgenomates bacterium]|nr:MAG: glycosyltransferase [Candidatus Microgenomates bacterium]
MKINNYKYQSILLYASLQFCGNVEEYFVKNTKKLAVLIIQPRVKNKDNLLRLYIEGKLVKEEKIKLSENIFFYYAFWYLQYLRIIFSYFTRKDRVIIITSHPISFFGMTLQKLLRRAKFVFWIEYFPTISLINSLFDNLKKHYHKRTDYACYFGDRVNKLMNGSILNTKNRRTILWGVKPKIIRKKMPGGRLTILFVGLIKESQGLDLVFNYLKNNKNYQLKILGVCSKPLYKNYQKLFKKYNISEQIFFPNKFFSEKELQEISKECFVGIAPYTTDKTNGTYFIDPGKIKAYAELGIPIIMSNTSAIATYVKRFKCGEIIERNEVDLDRGIKQVKDNYNIYLKGLEKFNKYFYYENHYAKKFDFLEN